MVCPSCSSAVADGRRFCTSCGTPMATADTGARVGAAATNGTSRRAPGRKATAATAAQPVADGAVTPYPAEPVPATAALPLPDAAAGDPGDPGSRGGVSPQAALAQDRTTQLDAPVDAEPTSGGRGMGAGAGDALSGAGEALAGAADAARRHAKRAADRFGAAPAEVRVAMIGAAVTVLSFLALPYADDVGTAARLGGRLWWRPIAAVVATVLLATTLRMRSGAKTGTDSGTTATAGAPGTARAAGNAADRLLAALVVATVGATEAGLVGLFSGDASGTRIGYYGMLAGLVTVLVAAVRATRRRCGGGVA